MTDGASQSYIEQFHHNNEKWMIEAFPHEKNPTKKMQKKTIGKFWLKNSIENKDKFLFITFWLNIKLCVPIQYSSTTRLEILFFPKLEKKLVAPPKSMTNDV